MARRLIEHEMGAATASPNLRPAAFHSLEKLRPHLRALVGDGGYRALLGRAVVLAAAELPELQSVRVNTQGSLDGADELSTRFGPNRFTEMKAVVLAQLLGLLAAFIGEELTLRLVREIWPKAHLHNFEKRTGSAK